MTRRVFVTGVGVVSSLGFGREAFWDALVSGRSGESEVTLFDTSGLSRHVACEVKDFRARDFLTAVEARRMGRCSAMTVAAARMAAEDAGVLDGALRGERTSVILGTTMGEANILGELEAAWFHRGDEAITIAKLPRYGTTLLPIHVARAFGALGMVQTLPAACAAGNYAIGFAADQIRAGRADVVISGAAELIEKLQFAGFCRLAAMAPAHCQPFDAQRKGILLGEGAGILILESEEHLVRRGGRALAEVGGYGLACDAHHITRPHPEGEGSLHAMRRALQASGIGPEDVDFINAHGTGTHANDPVESKVIRQVFGERRIPVTSNKGALGHCMGAASAIEAIACVLSLEHGVVPPTVHHQHLDEACDVDVVADQPLRGPFKVTLNNALAFGGYDAVACFARPGVFPETVGQG
jgi:3-oxoacyl-[acyl-carrier-protein] synthase II